MTNKIHYAEYLQLEKIVNSQKLESEKHGAMAHDEMLFIIIHQNYELWFKQVLFEINSIQDIFSMPEVSEYQLGIINHRLKRVNKIFNLLVDQIAIIETMTPQSFLEFRDLLVPASGFQSLQFRLLETSLGIRSKDRGLTEQKFFNSRLKENEKKILEDALKKPSLRDQVDSWLCRLQNLDIGLNDFWKDFQSHIHSLLNDDLKSIIENETLSEKEKEFEKMNLQSTLNSFDSLFDSKKYEELIEKNEVTLSREATLAALFISLYQEQPLLHLPFNLIQNLVELDGHITKWRQGHALMAKKMLGTKIGTGGSSGHDYLKKTADRHSIFKDFFNLSSFLLPVSKRPILSKETKKNLGYFFEERNNV